MDFSVLVSIPRPYSDHVGSEPYEDTESYSQSSNGSGAETPAHSVEERIGNHDEDLFAAESAVDIRALDGQIIETRKGVSVTVVQFVDGEKHVFLDEKFPRPYEDGEIMGIKGTSWDFSQVVRRLEERWQ